MINRFSYQHWLFQVANALLLLSYLQFGLLWLRLVLILASVAFIVWGIWILNIALDTVLWNLILLIINAVLAIPLFLKMLPVPLGKYKAIYKDHFASFFDKGQFKKFMKYSEHKVYKETFEIEKQGLDLKKYYFFYDIPSNAEVTVFKQPMRIITEKNKKGKEVYKRMEIDKSKKKEKIGTVQNG